MLFLTAPSGFTCSRVPLLGSDDKSHPRENIIHIPYVKNTSSNGAVMSQGKRDIILKRI